MFSAPFWQISKRYWLAGQRRESMHPHARSLALVGPVKAALTEIAPALVQSVAGLHSLFQTLL